MFYQLLVWITSIVISDLEKKVYFFLLVCSILFGRACAQCFPYSLYWSFTQCWEEVSVFQHTMCAKFQILNN